MKASKAEVSEESVLYRKYRPSTFKEILGQDHIVRILADSIDQGNVAHAYLFSGSRGTGKTSLARIVANGIGTTDKDLYEIDAASNRGIDDIRELRDAVNTLPFESTYKVYIIDEVHMLTKDAHNALLKTLEEPPKHAVFILATTEAEKLPETVVSRCQTFTFKKPSQDVLKKLIDSISKKEGFTLDDGVAELIATLADGSFRDAHGVLQKIIYASKDKKISLEEVETATGAPASTLINNTLEAIAKGDLERALTVLEKAAGQGVDMKTFLTLLLAKSRTVLLLRYAKELKSDLEEQYTKEDFNFLNTLSADTDTHITSELLYTLLDAQTAVGFATVPQLPIELALIKILK